MGKKAVVIGSGFGGIAISLRLKKLGYDTTIIEKLDELEVRWTTIWLATCVIRNAWHVKRHASLPFERERFSILTYLRS